MEGVTNKIRNGVFRYVLKHFGFGNRAPRCEWEQTFASGVWDYLATADEAGHYDAIVEFYRHADGAGDVLDVGCGKGVLYRALRPLVMARSAKYVGVDISQNAVDAARRQFAEGDFNQVDFENESVDGKFDVIVFNESLYYFTRPLKVLQRSVAENLKPSGVVIVSMFAGNEKIWRDLAKHFEIVAAEIIENDKGLRWKVKLLQPAIRAEFTATSGTRSSRAARPR